MRAMFIALAIVSVAHAALADDERVTVKIVGKEGTDIEQAAVGDAASVTWKPLCTTPSYKTTQDVLFVTGGASALVGGVLLVAGFQIRPSARATLVVAGNGASLTYKW